MIICGTYQTTPKIKNLQSLKRFEILKFNNIPVKAAIARTIAPRWRPFEKR